MTIFFLWQKIMAYALMKNIINLKILLFLSSMRSYADNLKKNSFKLTYSRIDSADFKSDYLTKIQKVVKKNKIKEISFFEIEDKPFEKKILDFVKKNKIKLNIIQNPNVFKF